MHDKWPFSFILEKHGCMITGLQCTMMEKKGPGSLIQNKNLFFFLISLLFILFFNHFLVCRQERVKKATLVC